MINMRFFFFLQLSCVSTHSFKSYSSSLEHLLGYSYGQTFGILGTVPEVQASSQQSHMDFLGSGRSYCITSIVKRAPVKGSKVCLPHSAMVGDNPAQRELWEGHLKIACPWVAFVCIPAATMNKAYQSHLHSQGSCSASHQENQLELKVNMGERFFITDGKSGLKLKV